MTTEKIPTMPPDPIWLRRWATSHGGLHTTSPADWLPLILFILLSCGLIAATPPTPGWKLVRASLVPFMLCYQAYFALFTLDHTYEVHWGNVTGQLWHATKALEVLLFYPPEEHCFRVRPRLGEKGTVELESEPVPPPWTRAKFYWSFNIWFSQRGIGWNYTAPLPDSSRGHPFTRTSTRTAFLINRGIYISIVYLVCDLARAYMTFGPGAAFFSGRLGVAPSYDSLTIAQRALYSVPVAARVLWSMEEWYTPISLIMVTIGGIAGWEGEWWSPWGWPPLFGTIKDLWVHPGLSHMWSKTWHQYFHHWLYLFGWLGIGETILRLPHSGISSRPIPPPSTLTPTSTPSSSVYSRAASPAHPLPTTPPSSRNRTSPKIMASNFAKSIIVFTLTGLYHDLPSYLLLLHTSPPSEPIPLAGASATTAFFILQPLALAVEAYVKRHWRGWKNRAHPEWAKGGREPAWLVTTERAVGFVWTWWWLGHTARYFVVGLTRAGLYLRQDGQPERFSPAGGMIYGQWYH